MVVVLVTHFRLYQKYCREWIQDHTETGTELVAPVQQYVADVVPTSPVRDYVHYKVLNIYAKILEET
jgi:hypothetical protein